MNVAKTTTVPPVVEFAGRLLLASLFLMSGIGKLNAYSGTAGYMAASGVPAMLLPLVIALEIAGALAIIVGWRTRIVAFLLAGFTLLAAAIFHSHFSDHMQMLMFMKNLAIAGGFLVLVVHGAGPLSLDARRR